MLAAVIGGVLQCIGYIFARKVKKRLGHILQRCLYRSPNSEDKCA